MSTLENSKKAILLITLLIGTTACDEALEQVEQEVRTAVGPALTVDPATGQASDERDRDVREESERLWVFGELPSSPDEDPSTSLGVPPLPPAPSCEQVTHRVMLSADHVTQTRKKALAELNDRALDVCGRYRSHRIEEVRFEDHTFYEQTEIVCLNWEGAPINVPVETETFGTKASASIKCGVERPGYDLALPRVQKSTPIPAQLETFDVPPTCTIDGGAACCDSFRCCLDMDGGDGYCIERFGATAIFGR